jgi:predicted Zn finger-like uncharacterized protein
MPELVSCPDCQSKLRVPDHLLGKKVKCPRCGNPFQATAEQPAPPPEEEEEAPRPRKPARREEYEEEAVARKRKPARPPEDEEEEIPVARRRRDEDDEEESPRARRRRRDEDEEEDVPVARRRRDEEDEDDYEPAPIRKQVHGTVTDWKRVRLGITLVIYSIFIALGDVLLACCAQVVVAFLLVGAMQQGMQQGARPEGLAVAAGGSAMLYLAVLIVEVVVLLACVALSFTGNVFCIFAPPKHGAKILALVALILFGVSLLGAVGAMFLPAIGTTRAGGGVMAAASGPVALGGGLGVTASWVVFLFFLRGMAKAMKDHGLAQSVVYLVVMAGITVLLHVVFACVMVLATAGLFASAAERGNIGGMERAYAGASLVSGIFALVIVCLYLASFIWYIITLFQVRGATSRHLGRRG